MLFANWCDAEQAGEETRRLTKLRERQGGRVAVAAQLSETIRSHYDDVGRIAQDIVDLGYPQAAAILAERMPRSVRARSGELGEILATEFVEESTSYRVPVRRLRYKDGREMALRGDDLIGIDTTGGGLKVLKGESKSRLSLNRATINEARRALSNDGGCPTPTSLLFMADRLMEHDDERADVGRLLRREIATRSLPPANVAHAFFAVSGNAAPAALQEDLNGAGNANPQMVIHLHIADHQEFIAAAYQGALALGDH